MTKKSRGTKILVWTGDIYVGDLRPACRMKDVQLGDFREPHARFRPRNHGSRPCASNYFVAQTVRTLWSTRCWCR